MLGDALIMFIQASAIVTIITATRGFCRHYVTFGTGVDSCFWAATV